VLSWTHRLFTSASGFRRGGSTTAPLSGGWRGVQDMWRMLWHARPVLANLG